MKDSADKKTPDMLKRPRGRPAKAGGAMSGAERVAKLRAERKAAGVCPCCGQAVKRGSGEQVED
jgi:hypothetical protein